MAYIKKFENVLDEVTSAQVLKDTLPEGRMETFVEAVSDIRAANEEAYKISNFKRVAGMSDSGNWMRVATIPLSVIACIEQVEPGFFQNKKRFYRWLNRHPEYQCVKYRAMTSR
jgi:hypothetical protein